MKQPARAARGKPAAKRKSREDLNNEARERKREKKHRGHASGSRANPVQSQNNKQGGAKAKDPRIGSKKPIPLLAEGEAVKKPVAKPAAQPKKAPLSPAEELEMLENDPRLDGLLDRLESGDALSGEEQAWLDETLDRIDILMEELGIKLDDDADDEQAEEDMLRLLKGN